MKKHIASIITGSRIIFSLPLLFLPFPSAEFYILYLFCGLSDMIDGAVARATGTVSKFGARLDTAADLAFMLVCFIKLLPVVHIPLWLWVWIIIIAIIKIFNIAQGFIRTKKLISIHSVLNKATGFLLFLLPLSFPFVEATYSVAAICAIATIAAADELYLILRGKEVL